MKQKILTLIVCLLIFNISVIEIVNAQDNYSLEAGVTSRCEVIEKTADVVWIYAQYGTPPNTTTRMHDGNDNTTGCRGTSDPFQTAGFRNIIYEGTLTFAETVSEITTVEYVMRGRGSTGSEELYLWYSGGWNLVSTLAMYTGGKTTRIINGPWNDVTGMKLRMDMQATDRWLDSAIYELKAFGPAAPLYIDIGLKVYNGTDPVPIACCDPAGTETSPLKIVGTDGITYDVALVEPTDPIASVVRIQTSSGIEALRKYE